MAIIQPTTTIKEDYKGYEIHTKKQSHCSLIYQKGKFISAVAGSITGSTGSVNKAKSKIDEIIG